MPVEVVTGPCLIGIDEIEYIDKDNSVTEGRIAGVVICDVDGLSSYVDVASQRLSVGSVDARKGGAIANGDELGRQGNDDGSVEGYWLDGEVVYEVDRVVLPVYGEAVSRGLVDLRARRLHAHAHIASPADHH